MAAEIRFEVAERAARLRERGIVPKLNVVLVGDRPDSATYVRGKERAAQEAGIEGGTLHLPETTSEAELLELIHQQNEDVSVHGVLVQTPLPPQIDQERIMASLNPAKDVDGLHPENLGWLLLGSPRFVGATPLGVQQMLIRSGIDPSGKHVVICGRSEIVGRPLAALMLQKRAGANATVTVCHTGTRDLAEHTRQADILVAAIGRPRAISAEMVKRGAVVIDVGINTIPDSSRRSGQRLVGDVDYDAISEVASAITPVPGGVGPMTIAMLLSNAVQAAGG
jgi:methylenetetrahydrofolate dehydrogenase (NADP+)/methenyltetrahydrofolate cyclohydrolase